MKFKKLITTLTILSLVCMVGVFGFGASGEIVVGVDAAPETMDPHGSISDSNMMWMGNVFDSLIQIKGPDGELAPGLATSWEQIDPLTWRFELRKGVEFHNGNPFTWEDVKFSYERMKTYEYSEHSWAKKITSVEKVDGDPWTIEIKTETPTPSLVYQMKIGFIMDKESTEARSRGEVTQYPVGTGAYEFEEWVKGSHLTLTANENYWGVKPTIKKAVVRPIAEPSTRFAALATDKIDLMMGVPLQMLESVKGDSKLEMVTRPSRRVIFLGLSNQEDMPTSNIKVRKAMYMAINEKAIIKSILLGQGAISSQIVDPQTLGYNHDIERYSYNPDKAKELLEEAGYGDGFKITLQCPNDRYVKDEQIGQAVVKYLREVGIEAKLDAMPKANYWGLISGHKTKFWMLGWMNESHDLGNVFSMLVHSPTGQYGGWNSTYGDPELNSLIEEQKQIEDKAEREKALKELNKIAMEEKVAYLPLHRQKHLYALRKSKDINFDPRPDRWIMLKEISLD